MSFLDLLAQRSAVGGTGKGSSNSLVLGGGRGSSSVVVSTTHNGSLTLLQGKLKDGTQAAGAYMAGVKRNGSVVLFLNLLLDNSGSMGITCASGRTRLEVVLGCVQTLCDSPFVDDDDSLVVHTCNGEVRWRLTCLAKRYNHARLARDIASNGGPSGCTRLWDGILTSYKNMKEHDERYRDGKKVLRYLLAFTDGGDNASTTEVDRLSQTLAKPGLANFHVVVIAAGLGTSDQLRLQRLLGDRPHCKLITVASASELDITHAFDDALSHLRTLIVQLGGGGKGGGQQHVVSYEGHRNGVKGFEEQLGKQMSSAFKSLSILDAGKLTGGGGLFGLPSSGGQGNTSRPQSRGRNEGRGQDQDQNRGRSASRGGNGSGRNGQGGGGRSDSRGGNGGGNQGNRNRSRSRRRN